MRTRIYLRRAYTVAIGMAVLVAFAAPGIGFGFLGYVVWGPEGELLSVAPYFAAFVLLMAYAIGEEFKRS